VIEAAAIAAWPVPAPQLVPMPDQLCCNVSPNKPGGPGKCDFHILPPLNFANVFNVLEKTIMTLSTRLVEYISFEHEDALREIAQLCRRENWRLAVWDISAGLEIPGQNNAQTAEAGSADPLAAVRSINALAAPDTSAVLVLVNAHRFLQSAEIVQALVRQITAGKQNRTFVIVLSPVVQIPTELEKLFTVVEHDLPDRGQLEEIAKGVATEQGELPEGEDLIRLLDAAAGLTTKPQTPSA
jgi:hypothetical protein